MSASVAAESPTVAEWLALVARDEPLAWRHLRDAARHAANRSRGRADDAEDVASECVLRVMSRVLRGRPLAASDTALRGLCAGFVARILRERRRQAALLSLAAADCAHLAARRPDDDPDSPTPAVADGAARGPAAMTERQALVRAALDAGLSVRAAARRLGVSRQAVAGLVARSARRAVGLTARGGPDRSWAADFAACDEFDANDPSQLAVAMWATGRSCAEIAATLGVGVEAARSRLRRLRAEWERCRNRPSRDRSGCRPT